MRNWIWIATAAALMTAGLFMVEPKSATADEYWDGYWGWYDGTYRPYVTRRYYSSPSAAYGSPYYYGPSYGYYPRDRYYYGRPYYGEYYGTPNFGYRDYPGSGGQVRVGPLRFGWR